MCRIIRLHAAASSVLVLAALIAPCLAQQISPYEQAKAHQFLRVRLSDTEETLAQCVARADVVSTSAEARLKWVLDNWVAKTATEGVQK